MSRSVTAKQIAAQMSSRMGIKYDVVWPIVQEFLETVVDTIDEGNNVRLLELGLFQWRRMAARSGVSVNTGERWHRPPQWKVRWAPSTRLKKGKEDGEVRSGAGQGEDQGGVQGDEVLRRGRGSLPSLRGGSGQRRGLSHPRHRASGEEEG